MEGKSYNILTHLNKKSIYFHLHIQLIQDYSMGLGDFQILVLFSGKKKKKSHCLRVDALLFLTGKYFFYFLFL